jgi:hypothetical protein
MNLNKWRVAVLTIGLLWAAEMLAESVSPSPTPSGRYAAWSRGPSNATNFFPIAVWLQDPRNAAKYQEAGFNTYVGLWKGPTVEQLAALKKVGMRLICDQNEVALQRLGDETIIGWMHGDEPDNAQSLGEGLGWGDPIAPEKIVSDYQKIRSRDPSRPVLLNLGQGVAWDDYYGRGRRTRHPEDYPRYMEGSDLVSFDIYPAVHDRKEVAGKLWYVARGVERLVQWGKGSKIVWNCLECTRISNTERKPTPHEVRAEAWMSIIHGSCGLIYFVHQFEPVFREAALLDDGEMLAAVKRINAEIKELAPVLNAGTPAEVEVMESIPKGGQIAHFTRRWSGATYLFAVEMQGTNATGVFKLGANQGQMAEVLGEKRQVQLRQGMLEDSFKPWDVHLYRLADARK